MIEEIGSMGCIFFAWLFFVSDCSIQGRCTPVQEFPLQSSKLRRVHESLAQYYLPPDDKQHVLLMRLSGLKLPTPLLDLQAAI